MSLIHSIIAVIEGIFVSIYGLGVFFAIVPVCWDCMLRGMTVMLLLPLSFPIIAFALYSTGFIFSSAYKAELSKRTSRTLFIVHIAYEILFVGFILFWIWLQFFADINRFN